MRILVYALIDRGGGIANFLQLVRAMVMRHPEDHFTLVCPEGSELLGLGAQRENVTVSAVPCGKAKEVRRLLLGVHGLRTTARSVGADVIWSLNFGPYLPPGVPCVLSVHNSHQVYPWPETRTHPGSCLRRIMLRWFFRRSLANADAVVVQTELMKRYVGQLPMAPARIAVIPKAVEARDASVVPLPGDLLRSLEDGLGRKAFTFLYVATLTPHKNHKVLLRAGEILRANGTLARVAITLTHAEIAQIGGDSARELMASGHIVPLNWVHTQHLRALYDACDACVMPSVMESLSSAHLEAMSWGKPQITADLPYARDVCGDAAIYVAPETASDWAVAMRRVLEDQTLRSHLTEAGYRRMRHFPATWDQAARLVYDFLASVAKPCPSVIDRPEMA